MQKKDIIKKFKLDQNTILDDKDILIDLESEWFDTDTPYQINVDGVVREIDVSKVNKDNQILFGDEKTKQITILSLDKNRSSNEYKYTGDLYLFFAFGQEQISVVDFDDHIEITKVIRIIKSKKMDTPYEKTSKTYPKTKENLLFAKKEYDVFTNRFKHKIS